ncbi:flavin-containing monooxygenase [Brevibacterium sp. UCMA 11754]|uniref:flavin-containing monooxygenase n=1 Tax=Brevibacterium sp. UCMA 11754 TaxID=2749198 RepID=UPI001F393DF8|nr:NAD(P)/FAD-dependent oxidoreductase [Brevibacterium sp. UCMA 11754]MCF2573896.1 NAD(P)/FAD-dependent oxidoreductase [Brevibacterium sp. UCMA 11754]
MTTTSPAPSIPQSKADALRQRYAEERDKRQRSDGLNQYVRVSDTILGETIDPHMPVIAREPKADHVTFAVIGGGFAGLVTGARLKEKGIADVRIIDKAGDFGGVWYWNRYPGIMCDTSSFVYMPLLEETGHVPTEKFAHGPEIRRHCQQIGQQYGLYDNALLHTLVTGLRWDDEESVWHVRTNRGDDFTADFVSIGVGPLHVAKLPKIEGIDEFAGKSFHTTQWDYDYTGGSPDGGILDRLADKRIAVIGTGATAIQAIPELAKSGAETFVFQRTPTSVDVRGNGPIDPEWFAGMSAEAGWQQGLFDNFAANWEAYRGDPAEEIEDLVGDGWTQLGRRLRDGVRAIPPEEFSPERMMQALENVDFATMEDIRSRVDELVTDPKAASGLKAWYSQLCKRPGFHDEYLQSFNRPNVHLVDTDGKGVERITATGVVVAGQEYEVDCIIYATGFEYLTDYASRLGFPVEGRDGRTLSAHWDEGMRTFQGIHMHGFPNLFLQQMLQAAFLGANVPQNYVETSKNIAAVVVEATGNGTNRAETTAAAEEEWVAMHLEQGQPFGSAECTPGYYNNEGTDSDLKNRHNVGYPGGATGYFKLIDEWRAAGDFVGLNFGKSASTSA